MNYGCKARLLTAAVAGALLAAGLWAESRARIVHISFLTLPAETRHPAALLPGRWTPALLNAPVVEGESLRTGDTGQAEVELECGSALRLASNSRVTFTRLRRHDDGVAETSLTLDPGRYFFSLRRDDARDFHLQLPGARVATLRGAARFQIRVQAANAGSLDVTGGEAEVRVGATVYEVKKSSRLLWVGAGHAQQLPLGHATDAESDWSQKRDRMFDRALMASRLRPAEQMGAQIRGLPTPEATPGAPAASAWSILSGSVAAMPPDPAPPWARNAAAIPACGRY